MKELTFNIVQGHNAVSLASSGIIVVESVLCNMQGKKLKKDHKQSYPVFRKLTVQQERNYSLVRSVAATSENNCPVGIELINFVLNTTHPQSYRFMRDQRLHTAAYLCV